MSALNNLPPLLITASLDAGRTPQVALSDVHKRTLRHMEGLLAWLKAPGVERVIFAKNCTLSIRHGVLVEAAASHGKELEFIQGTASSRTSVQGKGYGEGDLIRQVLEKSAVLRASREFIKVTGKLFMPEALSVFTGEGGGEFFETSSDIPEALFPTRHWIKGAYRSIILSRGVALLKRSRVPWGWIAAVPAGWIDTRCYRSTVEYYRNHLLRSHERVQDALGYTLENAVFDDLQRVESIRRISSAPVIVGMSGTLGTQSGSFSDNLCHEAADLTTRLLSV